jgi:(1->4)-alpha-D-glucan 1-alpha-D-glucosylmutase
MTTLSTHDTKRSEDVRARLAVLSEVPETWADAVERWHELSAALRSDPGTPDGVTENLLWQTLVGAWPVSAERLVPYLTKAMREARLVTSWGQPDEDAEKAVAGFAVALLEHPGLVSGVEELVASIALPAAVNTLGQKLVQLGMPGVPDVYQGNELHDLSLVDPDNRRPVDFARRRELLAALDGGATLGDLETTDGLDRAKLLVTSRLLRLRRDRPHWFGPDAGYRPLTLDGERAGHGVAFARGEAVLLATRLPVGLARAGGWGETRLPLPGGDWTELLTGRPVAGGAVRVADLLAGLPVAVLVPRSHDQAG